MNDPVLPVEVACIAARALLTAERLAPILGGFAWSLLGTMSDNREIYVLASGEDAEAWRTQAAQNYLARQNDYDFTSDSAPRD